MGICTWLGRKEEVSLFDNGLRIESSLKILNDDKWQNRYVVCQRRCLSEAPLLGIFKNGGCRERGEHLELFYLQNYIGYEYGFKFRRSNKTLAILIQGQTLIFSFSNVESMVFWKEWLKDVCGRSAMYFVKCHTIPKDNSVIKLNSRSARIHITRYALVIVQEVPPKQRLYLNLEDLSDVECVQNRFSFRALTYPWSTPQSFVFTSDQIPELTAKLQCLLKTKQYLNQGSQASRLPSLKSSSLGQASSSHQQLLFSPSPLYANEGRQTPSPVFTSLYANEGHCPQSQSSEEEEEGGAPPSKKKSIEEGPYAIPVDLGSEQSGGVFVEDILVENDQTQSKNDAQDRPFDDLQFIEGTPAQFLNQQLVSEASHFSLNAAPPGLVKPTSDSAFFTFAGNGHHKLGRSLSRKLKRQLAGSYTKYDGEKSNSISYTRESNGSTNCGGVRLTKSVTPVREMDNVISKKIDGYGTANRQTKNEPFVSSSIRIDSAIQRGSERLKWSQRSSTSNSQRESSVENEEQQSNSEKSSLCENVMAILAIHRGIGESKPEEQCIHLLKSEEEMSMSTATFGGASRRVAMNGSAVTDENNTYGGSFATTVHNMNTPLANSLNEVLETTTTAKGIPSAMSLQEKNSPLYASCEKFMEPDATSSRSLSICSELNARIMQRGGRTRVSGRSNKDRMIQRPSPPSLPPPLPPRKQSSQPCFSKNFTPTFDGDYVDIDAMMDNNQSDYINKSVFIRSAADRKVPKFQSYSTTDYIQICPSATSEFRKTNPSTQTPIRRSSSLYDFILSQQIPGHSLGKSNNEAEYYAGNWELFPPKSFVSSSSHLLSRPKGTLKKEKSDILPN